MLFELLATELSRTPGNVIAGRVKPGGDVERAVRRTRPDVLVLLVDRYDAPAPLPLLYDYPPLKLLTITGHGHSATLHELRLRTVSLTDFSAAALQVALSDSGEGRLN